MTIRFHPSFKKAYKSRILPNKKLRTKTIEKIRLFQENPANQVLKNNSLTGAKKRLRAFSVAGDIRIVYLPISEDEVIFLDIGSHNQVY